MFQKQVIIQKDGKHALSGIIRLPNEEGKFPSVVLCHGWNPEREHELITEIAMQLTYNGFATLCFNFSGHKESEGSFEKTTVTQMRDDLEMAWDFFSTFSQIDPKKRFLLGHSMGGMVAAASWHSLPELQKFVFIAIHSDFQQLINSYFSEYEQQEWRKTGIARLRGKYPLHKSVLLDMNRYSLPEILRQIKCPVLIVHGTADIIIPVQQARIVYSLLQHPELEIFEEADHQFSQLGLRQEMMQRVIEWLRAKG